MAIAVARFDGNRASKGIQSCFVNAHPESQARLPDICTYIALTQPPSNVPLIQLGGGQTVAGDPCYVTALSIRSLSDGGVAVRPYLQVAHWLSS